MGKVGFGSYRISVKSNEHQQALVRALELGCSLIDTSANYTNGESEELIGLVLKDHPHFNPTIVTKGGYIQGNNLALLNELQQSGKGLHDLVDINETLKHSIHPDFLKTQIDGSLKRLRKDSIDTFLLHNPEYYFKTEDANQADYYQRIKKAFEYLEEEVQLGRIKNYGISSNNFILPPHKSDATNLQNILKVALEVSTKNHFHAIQFPFNLIEIGALEKLGEYGDESLLESAKLNNLITMINRPLNAFSNDQLVRLATYEWMTVNLDHEKAFMHFEKCMSIMEAKWQEAKNDDDQAYDEKFSEITLVKQFREIWNNLPSADSVEQVYYGHFFPFLARLWGHGGLSAKEAAPFYELFEYSLLYSRSHMTSKAQSFRDQAQSVGLIEATSDQPFSVQLVESYLSYGIDYVLIGMKRSAYVEQMKHLF